MKTYIFKTNFIHKKSISRTIEVPEHFDLEDLARSIVEAYNFDLDHCYGFYNRFKRPYHKSEEQYELFKDLGGDATGESIYDTYVSDVKCWKRRGGKMLFYFDYGDDWLFRIEVKDFGKEESKIKYPRLINSKGEAPEQYPCCKDE